MKTLRYSFVDKSAWPRGDWDNEPDKIQFVDKDTGLPALIVRNQSGALCGYVGVDKNHPFYKIQYSSCSLKTAKKRGFKFEDVELKVTESLQEYKENRLICEEEYCNHRVEHLLDVHGGITFSDSCQDHEHGICHKVEEGEDDNIWWFGFDCAHLGDMVPAFSKTYINVGLLKARDLGTYKNMYYVRQQIRNLAKQLKHLNQKQRRAVT